ncbi:MAG: hypothetical protein HQK53_03880 [Oligoflexia bacterium]|nr:hypothetical protein [Oligoflexia bacterium]
MISHRNMLFLTIFTTLIFYCQVAKSSSAEAYQPTFFDSIEEMVQSPSLELGYGDIIFVAVGSYNPAGDHNSFGYAQSLPSFIEKFLKNLVLKPHVKIILIDENFKRSEICAWAKGYEESDLRRYLIENNLQRFESNLYIVRGYLRVISGEGKEQPNENLLQTYLTNVLNKNGAVFLSNYTANCPLLSGIYNNLLSASGKSDGKVFLIDKSLHIELPINKNILVKAAAMFWDGSAYDPIDAGILFAKANHLNDLINAIRPQESFVHDNYYEPKFSTQEFAKIFGPLKQAIEQDNYKSDMQENLFDHYLAYHDICLGIDKCPEQEIKYVIENFTEINFPHHCTIGTILPTQQSNYFPLIDFDAIITQDEKGNASVSVVPLISVAKNPFDFFGLLDNKATIYDLGGIPQL